MSEDPEQEAVGMGYPFDYWIEQAHRLADHNGFPRSFIGEAAQIVRTAFTPEWLQNVFDRGYSKHSMVPQAPHHLDTLFCVAGASQISELLELATYLKCLCRTKNLDTVIQVMKDNYATGLLQLGYAYRLHRAGATNIELEPGTGRGKSDIYFEYDTRPYLTECYVPMRSNLPRSVDNLVKCREMISRACNECPENLRVCIRLKESISVKQGNDLGYRLSRIIRSLTSPYVIKLEEEIAECEVRPILPGDEGDLSRVEGLGDLATRPDVVFDLYSVPQSDIAKLRAGKDFRRREGGRLLFWSPTDEKQELTDDEYIEDLKKKLSKKLGQAKREQDRPGRIVMAELTWFTEDKDRCLRIGQQLQRRLVPKHQDLAAIFLVQRTWTTMSRYMYCGLLIGGPSSTTIPDKLFSTINSQEGRLDILSSPQ